MIEALQTRIAAALRWLITAPRRHWKRALVLLTAIFVVYKVVEFELWYHAPEIGSLRSTLGRAYDGMLSRQDVGPALRLLAASVEMWALLSLAAMALILWLLWTVPRWQVRRTYGVNFDNEFERENEARKTLAQILGGVVVLVGLYFSWQTLDLQRQGQKDAREAQLASEEATRKTLEQQRKSQDTNADAARTSEELSRKGQIADRFTKAVAQLGDEKVEIRLGGIYALERIAQDSSSDSPVVLEVLAAYVRQRLGTRGRGVEGVSGQAMVVVPEMKVHRLDADIEAILRVLARQKSVQNYGSERTLLKLNLERVDLSDAEMEGLDLSGFDLRGARFNHASLRDANFGKADLVDAEFNGAMLKGARFTGAKLTEARLISADLLGADFREAELSLANLERAKLFSANLAGAVLYAANLAEAELERADLSGAVLTEANFLTRTQLGRAYCDQRTQTEIDKTTCIANEKTREEEEQRRNAKRNP